eukprot:m.61753 g.61753  ORF g.61753 m.61753 type:complete len:325 (-) comp8004_c0_seq3:574-1548(-)
MEMMEVEGRNEKKNERDIVEDPGNKIHGNFPFYYQFNPVEARLDLISDEQLKCLVDCQQQEKGCACQENSMCENGVCDKDRVICLLDIGCNRGDLTIALAKRIHELTGHPVVAEGWDIDKALIMEAKQQFGPLSGDGRITCEFRAINVSNEDEFTAASTTTTMSKLGKRRFDLVCLFSVTMWIHVHSGDDEFLNILDRIYSISNALIVEPQESKSYGSCRRRIKRVGGELPPKLDELRLRGDKLFPAIRNGIGEAGFVALTEKSSGSCGSNRSSSEGRSSSSSTIKAIGNDQCDHSPFPRKEQQNVEKTAWKRPLWLFKRSEMF